MLVVQRPCQASNWDSILPRSVLRSYVVLRDYVSWQPLWPSPRTRALSLRSSSPTSRKKSKLPCRRLGTYVQPFLTGCRPWCRAVSTSPEPHVLYLNRATVVMFASYLPFCWCRQATNPCDKWCFILPKNSRSSRWVSRRLTKAACLTAKPLSTLRNVRPVYFVGLTMEVPSAVGVLSVLRLA